MVALPRSADTTNCWMPAAVMPVCIKLRWNWFTDETAMENNGALNGPAGPRPFALHHDPWGRLVLTDAEGRQHTDVEVVRAFPLSDPHHGIAICDAQGRELVWIPDLDVLPPSLTQQIEEELAQREFVPIIRRIVKVSAPVEPSQWEVE